MVAVAAHLLHSVPVIALLGLCLAFGLRLVGEGYTALRLGKPSVVVAGMDLLITRLIQGPAATERREAWLHTPEGIWGVGRTSLSVGILICVLAADALARVIGRSIAG